MERLLDRFAETTNGLRSSLSEGWTVQSVAIVCMLGLALVALFTVQPQTTATNVAADLFPERRLTSTELQRIEAAFGESMLTDYGIESGHIVVPTEKRGQYLLAIREAKAMPQSFHVPTEEAIGNTTWIENSRQQSQRLHHADEKEARLAICALPGVVDAFVHIDVVEDESLYRRTKSSAVIGVETRPGEPLDEQSFRAIQAMAVNFKAGLSADAVTITDLSTGKFFLGSMDSQKPEAIAALRKADLERSWRKKLSSAISFAEGAQLTVNVVPSQDSLNATSVRCSISIPRTIIANESSASRRQDEKVIRHRIQAALLPLIPRQDESLDDLIAVTVFDKTDVLLPSNNRWQRLASSPSFLAAVLVATAGVMSLLLMRNQQPAVKSVDEPPPSLRIYETDEVGEQMEVGGDTSEQLQQIVAENPDAVAESLSDFIDRAS